MKVLIADDYPSLRDVLMRAIDAEPGFEVAGQAGNGLEAVRLVEELHPDVVIMDYLMPEMDGIEATAEIKRRFPETVVVGFTSADDPAAHRMFQNVGAAQCVRKDESLDELLASLRALHTPGEGYTPSAVG